ncbi:MAG: hypothetical protein LBU76_11485 [Azoarcus sp.]|nr:hypothetical protein [Azoarcus sp.]
MGEGARALTPAASVGADGLGLGAVWRGGIALTCGLGGCAAGGGCLMD